MRYIENYTANTGLWVLLGRVMNSEIDRTSLIYTIKSEVRITRRDETRREFSVLALAATTEPQNYSKRN
jgi:hypothetical protein